MQGWNLKMHCFSSGYRLQGMCSRSCVARENNHRSLFFRPVGRFFLSFAGSGQNRICLFITSHHTGCRHRSKLRSRQPVLPRRQFYARFARASLCPHKSSRRSASERHSVSAGSGRMPFCPSWLRSGECEGHVGLFHIFPLYHYFLL